MSQPLLSIVIPAHNEEGSLPATVFALDAALSHAAIPHEIVIVDDHSTDGTAAVVERLRQTCPTLRLVRNERPGGFGHAVQTGIDSYKGDAFCLVMADGSDDPQDVIRYYAEFTKGHECVFGSRFMPGSRVINYPRHKLLLNRLANLFIQMLFGLGYNDITNAFKCYSRHVLDGLKPILSNHFNLTVELPLKAIIRGYSYTVVPISWYGRVQGVSKLRIREMGSRYLFVVLYALLERLLARGDYRRAGTPTVAARRYDPTAPEYPRPMWWALGFVALVHLLFAYTFPLNHLGGDTSGYFHVLSKCTSNLLFAPGYPFLAGLPLRIDVFGFIAERHPDAFRKLLLYAQHMVEVACLGLLLVALTRIYGRITAAIAVLIAGCSARAMGTTSSVYPEWLQGSLLITAFSFAVFAFTAKSTLRKALFYSVAFAAFTWCVLTKFNAMPFLPGLLAFFLFEKGRWQHRAKLLGVAALVAALNYAVFVVGFHKPATGTYALTYDRSWVLLTRLGHVYGDLPHKEGIATKRWLALSSALPPDYSHAGVGMFLHVDSVSPEIRAPFRQKAAYLLTADEKTLDAFLQRNPLPPGFVLPQSSLPISYFIGLRESDELGVRVFLESVRNYPWPYVSNTLRAAWAARTYATTEPTFPRWDYVKGVTEKVVPVGANTLRWEWQLSSRIPYMSNDPYIWEPGYYVFGTADALAPTRKTSVLVMAVGALLALLHGLRYGWTVRSATVVVLALLLCGFVVFSYAILDFRWKEWRLAYPVAAIIAAATFGWAIPEAVRFVTRRPQK
jgi:dolichol-phosphate mannosyltransferase